MTKTPVPTDRHPGETVMAGIDATVERLVKRRLSGGDPLEKQEAFLEEARRAGRARRTRRAAADR